MSFATRFATLRAPLSIAAAMGLSLGVAMPTVAFAQAAKPAAAQTEAAPAGGPTVVKVKGAPDVPDWQKQCGRDDAAKADVCVTAREFVSEQDQPVLAAAIYDVKAGNQTNRTARFLLPFGLALDTGIRFSVDRAGYIAGKFQVCMPNGCFAEVVLKGDLIASMKKGTTLNLAVRNSAGAEVVFAIPAAGFAKAFDGPAVDPKVIEERQKQLQQELERRSEEMRKQLEQAGPQGTPPAAPAQPAPANGAAAQ